MVNEGSTQAIHLTSLSWQWSALQQQQNRRGQLISHVVSSKFVGKVMLRSKQCY